MKTEISRRGAEAQRGKVKRTESGALFLTFLNSTFIVPFIPFIPVKSFQLSAIASPAVASHPLRLRDYFTLLPLLFSMAVARRRMRPWRGQ